MQEHQEPPVSQRAAIEDILQLAQALAEAHPDPYTALGGPLAFHRRVAELINDMPVTSITPSQLLARLRPFVAALRDGHTAIALPGTPIHAPSTGGGSGLPFDWDTASERIYIAGVYDARDQGLLGATLTAVGGVSFSELVQRMGALRGFDNAANNLAHVMEALSDRALLGDLVNVEPVSTDQVAGGEGSEIAIEVMSPAEKPHRIHRRLGVSGTALRPESALTLPTLNAADLASSFIGDGERVAYLRVGPLMRYREAFEIWRASGYERPLGDHLAAVATAALGSVPPADIATQIAAVPSATELLTTLCEEMARRRTQGLVVDLRESTGGNSFFASILEYVLYGVRAVVATDPGYQIRRYSPLYFANYGGASETEQRERLRNGGYDFTEEAIWRRWQREDVTAEELDRRRGEFTSAVEQSPTFARVVTPSYPGVTWPLQIAVVTSARTYSAGFDVAAQLVKHGARVIGVASGQAGNCFIDTLRCELRHSHLEVSVSFKRSLLFPENAERGAVLTPDVGLTHERLAAMNFDPHASVRLAIERLAAASA